HGRAVLAPVEPLDLPDVRLDPCILKPDDGVHHVPGTAGAIVGSLVAGEILELRLLGRHQELEHETASRSAKILGETPEAGRLAAVQGGVPLGVVTDEHLAEGRAELLDVADKLVAVLEIELLLPALLDRGGGEIPLARGVAQDRGAELLVDEDTGTLLRDARG